MKNDDIEFGCCFRFVFGCFTIFINCKTGEFTPYQNIIRAYC